MTSCPTSAVESIATSKVDTAAKLPGPMSNLTGSPARA
jgi:hypothetical protein